MERFIAYNTQTGLFYKLGCGFIKECQFSATKLDSVGLAVVRATFKNVGVIAARNGVEFPNCECDWCEATAVNP